MTTQTTATAIESDAARRERWRTRLIVLRNAALLAAACVVATVASKSIIEYLSEQQPKLWPLLATGVTLALLLKAVESFLKFMRIAMVELSKLTADQFVEAMYFCIQVTVIANLILDPMINRPDPANTMPESPIAPASLTLIAPVPAPARVSVPIAYFPNGRADACRIDGGIELSAVDRERMQALAAEIHGCMRVDDRLDIRVFGLASEQAFSAAAQRGCVEDLNQTLATERGRVAADVLHDAFQAADGLGLGRIRVSFDDAKDEPGAMERERARFLGLGAGLDQSHMHALARVAIASFDVPAGCQLLHAAWHARHDARQDRTAAAGDATTTP